MAKHKSSIINAAIAFYTRCPKCIVRKAHALPGLNSSSRVAQSETAFASALRISPKQAFSYLAFEDILI